MLSEKNASVNNFAQIWIPLSNKLLDMKLSGLSMGYVYSLHHKCGLRTHHMPGGNLSLNTGSYMADGRFSFL